MPHLLSWLAALAPVLLLLPGMVPPRLADARPLHMRRAGLLAAMGAAGLALVVALGLLAGGVLPGRWVHLDAVSATMFVLVAGIGAVVIAYSRRYLDGDAGQGRFVAWLCFTLAAVLVLVLAGNLMLFAVAWVVTSLGLHRLLLFYPDRPRARLAARKKWVASRAGEACLVLAILLVWQVFGTLDFAGIRAQAAVMTAATPAVHAIAMLVAAAALIKCAQFPLHGWLPEVMETPTPVSALLHAGIINAGGFLVLRMADVLALSGPALDLLLLVGAVTAVFGAAVMLVQTSVKGSLAWSTVAQMGFMMLQCGLGAFAAALLHIVAHALYKAHAFLSAGGVVAQRRPSPQAPLPLAMLLPALAVALLLVAGLALVFGMADKPGIWVLGAILLMGLAPTLAAGFAARRTPWLALRATLAGLGIGLAYFTLQVLAAWLFGPALPAGSVARGWLAPAIATFAVLGFAALLVLNVARRSGHPGPVLRALHVHLVNGFYVNALADRLLAPRKGAL